MTREEIEKGVVELANNNALVRDAIIKYNVSYAVCLAIAKKHNTRFRAGRVRKGNLASTPENIFNFVKEHQGAIRSAIRYSFVSKDGDFSKSFNQAIDQKLIVPVSENGLYSPQPVKHYYTTEYAKKNIFCAETKEVSKKEESSDDSFRLKRNDYQVLTESLSGLIHEYESIEERVRELSREFSDFKVFIEKQVKDILRAWDHQTDNLAMESMNLREASWASLEGSKKLTSLEERLEKIETNLQKGE